MQVESRLQSRSLWTIRLFIHDITILIGHEYGFHPRCESRIPDVWVWISLQHRVWSLRYHTRLDECAHPTFEVVKITLHLLRHRVVHMHTPDELDSSLDFLRWLGIWDRWFFHTITGQANDISISGLKQCPWVLNKMLDDTTNTWRQTRTVAPAHRFIPHPQTEWILKTNAPLRKNIPSKLTPDSLFGLSLLNWSRGEISYCEYIRSVSLRAVIDWLIV
jgi:hypothetical protein